MVSVTFPQVALPPVSGAACFEDAINWIMAENVACKKHPLCVLFCLFHGQTVLALSASLTQK